MSSSNNGGGTAHDAGVSTTAGITDSQQEYLDVVADDAEAAVAVIEGKLAGMKGSLVAARANAKSARAEADQARTPRGGK